MGLWSRAKAKAASAVKAATKVVQKAAAAIQSASSTAKAAASTAAKAVSKAAPKVVKATKAAAKVVRAATAVKKAASKVVTAKVSARVTKAASNVAAAVTRYVSSPALSPPPGQVSILPMPPAPPPVPPTPTLSAAEIVVRDATHFLENFEYTFTAIQEADPAERELLVEEAFRNAMSAANTLSKDANVLDKSVVLDEKAAAYKEWLPEDELIRLITAETSMRADMPFLFNVVAAYRQTGDEASAWQIVQQVSGVKPAANSFSDLLEVYGDSIPEGIRKVVKGTYSFLMLDSWAKVLFGYSFLEMRVAEPTKKDFVVVALDLALMGTAKLLSIGSKMTLSTAARVMSAASRNLPPTAATKVSSNIAKGASASVSDDIVQAATRAYAKGASSISIELEPGIRAMIQTAPLAAIPFWKRLAAEAARHPLITILGASFLLMQLDVTGWGFGLLPEQLRRQVTSLVGSIRSNIITIDDLQRDGKTAEAASLYAETQPMVDRLDEVFLTTPLKFWEKLGTDFATAKLLAEGVQAAYAEYGKILPGVFPPAWAEKTHGIVTNVVDGDSIFIDNMTGKFDEIRIPGIDAHEIGTEAGKIEADFLRDMILGKEVDVMVDSEFNPRGFHGRVLGTVYLIRYPEGKNLAVEMLQQFGENLLPPTKYHDRNKFIDWDLLKLAAEEITIPTSTLKITSRPSNGLIFLDGKFTGQLTPASIKDVMEGVHSVRVELPGYEAAAAVFSVPDILEHHVDLVELPEVPNFGTVSISTSPEYKLYVYANGMFMNEQTPSKLKLAPGNYDFTFVKPGFSAEPQTLMVEAGQEYSIVTTAAEVMKEPEEENTAVVAISSTPSSAAIYLDGLYSGHRTPYLFNLEAGDHLITIMKDGYKTWEQPITFEVGEEISFVADLIKLKEAELPIILIVSEPEAASIIIDTLPTRKKTPWYFSINPGPHVVRVEKEGFIPAEADVEIEEAAPNPS